MSNMNERKERVNVEKLLSDKDVNYIRELIVDYVTNLNRKELMALLKDFSGRRVRKVLNPIIRVWETKGK